MQLICKPIHKHNNYKPIFIVKFWFLSENAIILYNRFSVCKYNDICTVWKILNAKNIQ